MNTVTPITWMDCIPSSNDKAEMALPGTLMSNNLAAKRMGAFLQPEHFADPVHGRIFEAIMRRIGAGQIADVVTLRAEFEHADTLTEVGGLDYLGRLLEAAAAIINPHAYAQSINDAWFRRQAIDLAKQLHPIAAIARDQAFSMPDAGGALLDGTETLERLARGVGAVFGRVYMALGQTPKHCDKPEIRVELPL